ncbi:hypothetical protein COCNU_06G015860 [Cocos nucifera]|uniref:Uncharacterized protein n=1 Tax=Cocos nucifera TaxID=13894 RepID=A0A8K0ID94_COCNU|nr:hypothetical protein COCNU_06G015860 [Cocos nucifera]
MESVSFLMSALQTVIVKPDCIASPVPKGSQVRAWIYFWSMHSSTTVMVEQLLGRLSYSWLQVSHEWQISTASNDNAFKLCLSL